MSEWDLDSDSWRADEPKAKPPMFAAPIQAASPNFAKSNNEESKPKESTKRADDVPTEQFSKLSTKEQEKPKEVVKTQPVAHTQEPAHVHKDQHKQTHSEPQHSKVEKEEKEEEEDKKVAMIHRGLNDEDKLETKVEALPVEGNKANEAQKQQAAKLLSELYQSKAGRFEDLGLSQELLDGVYGMGWTKPSKIQELTLPILCRTVSSAAEKRHMIAQAQSGTGKTGAFSLGLLTRVDPTLRKPQAICVSPTRELAIQTFNVVKELSKHTKIETVLVVPEAEIPMPITAQVLIGTPGKLKYLFSSRRFDPSLIRCFVLDEADQLLTIENVVAGQQSMGQISLEMRKALSPECSIMLFSATYEDTVAKFATHVVPKEGRTSIRLKQEELSLDKITQYYIRVDGYSRKFDVVQELFDFITVGQSIIFLEKRATAKKLHTELSEKGHKVSLLHGNDMQNSVRDQVMASFRKGEAKVLITTNLLARGIDVSQVTLVINFDMPMKRMDEGPVERSPDRATYLHRIGRSGRFGRSGIAINLVFDDASMAAVEDFRDYFGRPIEPFPEDLHELDNLLKKLS